MLHTRLQGKDRRRFNRTHYFWGCGRRQRRHSPLVEARPGVRTIVDMRAHRNSSGMDWSGLSLGRAQRGSRAPTQRTGGGQLKANQSSPQSKHGTSVPGSVPATKAKFNRWQDRWCKHLGTASGRPPRVAAMARPVVANAGRRPIAIAGVHDALNRPLLLPKLSLSQFGVHRFLSAIGSCAGTCCAACRAASWARHYAD